jgi:uncharacterized protein (TIGR03435 family)
MIGQLTNHLFQSTLFALAAALLVLAFRKNRARVRYSLWLAASLKFLIPFSMLIALGSQIHWAPAAQAIVTRAASPDVVQTVEQFSEPFTVAIPASPRQTDRMPLLIAAMWFCGFAWIMMLRLRAWRGMRLAIRRSQPLDLGLPVEARLSSGVFEPGIVGLWRPMLLLPQGIIERLTPSELEAVIAHELCHIRRRDNLFAAIHMLIEALFWFHPLVWWIGAHLLDERERACDEHVLSLGNRPDIYADAILSVCKLYTESPLACVSGVTGADIRRRLETIMSNQKAAGLNLAKKTLLTCAAVVAVAGPLTIGLLIGLTPVPLLSQAPPPPSTLAPPPPSNVPPPPPAWKATSPEGAPATFEVASVKTNKSETAMGQMDLGPGKLNLAGFTLEGLVTWAYGMRDYQIVGAQPWFRADRYDVSAKAYGAPDIAHLKLLLQALLADRFKLALHRETRQLPAYTLTVDGKTRMRLSTGPAAPDAPQLIGHGNEREKEMTGQHAKVAQLIRMLDMDRPVADKTNLTGLYDFQLHWSPDGTDISIFTALREQLGLKLESTKGPVGVLAIDHAERIPTAN